MRIPHLVLALLLLLPLGPSAEAGGLDEMNKRLEALRARLETLLEEAKKDPRERLLKQYETMTQEQYKARRRDDVDADDIAEWIFEGEPPMHTDLRTRAVKSLVTRALYDPDLSRERRGSKSPRGKFSLKIVKFLDAEDPVSRKLASDLLRGLWDNAPVGLSFRPNNPSTWPPAIAAWKKFLRKK